MGGGAALKRSFAIRGASVLGLSTQLPFCGNIGQGLGRGLGVRRYCVCVYAGGGKRCT